MFNSLTKQLVVLSWFSLAGAAVAYGQSATEERSVGAFSRISVSGGIDVDLTQAETERVTVEVNGFELDDIVTEVFGDELRISNSERRGFSFFGHDEGDVKVYVDFVTLTALEASGGSDLRGRNAFELERLDIEASGGCDVTLDVAAERLSVEASGGSDVRLAGRATTLAIDASGGSDVDADTLEAEEVVVDASGGSDANVWANASIIADASGGSDVRVRGDPAERTVDNDISSDVRVR